ncbi:MmpS family transport accessory protein [Streptomyces sp. AP-93]|uniref:MmpS family transport accessory protein n=1 Tax=Streptomyces sp. AP-93 TaxID=2929048 RepID=UPI001FB01293|nr:MmpS family transport accessory protein [Streptomyces sp. AP-93]MCJ0874336.1 MmpS family transport accessory protein [Streptomyces sp. AP-93]
MRKSSATTFSALALAGLALAAAGCSAATADKAVDQVVDKAVNETYEVTYEVTGKTVDSVSFHDGGGTASAPNLATAEQPGATWTKTVTLRGIMPAAVAPSSVDNTADLTCKVIYKGKVIKEATGEAATAGGCVAVSPVTAE